MKELLGRMVGKLSCVVLFRGLPGSGKTTAARKVAAEHDMLHLDTDHFLVRGGQYRYTPERQEQAFAALFGCLRVAGEMGCDVVISGVFAGRNEIEKLRDMIQAAYGDLDHACIVSDMPALTVEESFSRNEHGVCRADIEKMAQEWEEWSD